MPDLIAFTPERVLSLTGAPRSGASYTAEFFLSGTTTPVTVYQDDDATVPHPATITANAAGVFPAVFAADGVGAIKAVIEDAAGGTFVTVDPVFRSPLTSSEAENIGFSPTVGIPETNVQAAIEAVFAGIGTGLADYGLGITGSAPLLAALDATNTPAGVYRYDTATTGTYPTGVLAATGGLVRLDRQTAAEAIMYLRAAGGARLYARHLAASAWGVWREVITVNDGATQGDILYMGASAWTRLAAGTALQIFRVNAGATAPEWTSVVPSGFGYTSGELTVAALDAHTLTHSLGAVPNHVEVYLLCKTTELGYAVNDRYGPIAASTSQRDQDNGFGMGWSATEIKIKIASDGWLLTHLTTGVRTAITPANWRMVVRAKV
jgi:hypothetical protein